MVVTRRAPAPPVASRTNSAQPIPRVKAQARPQAALDASSPLANGAGGEDLTQNTEAVDESPSKKAKGKWKNRAKKEKAKRKKGGSAFVEFLTRIFLLWFTIYTLSVCPSDEAHNSPICRGLSAYRRYVLEPYLVPPVQRALAHPSVAPYVDRATPVIQNTIKTAKPVLIRAQSEWNQRVVPQWKKRVVPQWHQHVDPQLDKYVWPHVAHATGLVTPYISTALDEYERKVGPQLRFALLKLHAWQHQARPYVILAAHKTYDGYQTAKPYAIPVLEQLKALLLQLVQFLGEQRQQFVDPQLQKIWERVKELGSGETKPVVTASKSFTASVSKASATASSLLSSVLHAPSAHIPAASEAVLGSASSVLPDVVSETESLPSPYPSTNPTVFLADADVPVAPVRSVSTFASSVSEDAATAVTAVVSAASSLTQAAGSSASSLPSLGSSVILDEAVPSAASFVQDSIVTPAASISDEVGASAQSVNNAAATALSQGSASVEAAASVASSVLGSATDQVTQTVASVASQVVPTPFSGESDDDLDLDDFYAELGLNELEEPAVPEVVEPNEPVVEYEEEDEETKAENERLLKEDTARKRADITSRHSAWEAKLEDRIARARKELRKSLVASRKAAAAELKESKEIRREVDSLVEDAEKYLKGAEKYLAGLKKDTKSTRTGVERQAMWERVVEKVDKKFEERLGQAEAVVNGWYANVLSAEVAEVERLKGEVQQIADNAQTDIGLDYAWLRDVTYMDWQRYHDLDRRAANFSKLAISIQDGTHPSPPFNPILPVMDELQNEVQDVVVGFENRIQRIRREGLRAFGAAVDDSDDVPSDETVSILPIEDDAHKPATEGESPAVPPVVIGRSKEEIASVLDRIAEQEAQATSPPDANNVDPEQVVIGLAKEVLEEGNLASSPASKHEEL